MFKQILLAACLLCAGFIAQSQTSAPTTDEAAIKQVIENESEYFWGRDYKKWKKTWLHEDHVRWTVATKDGVRQFTNWEDWNAEVKSLFESSPEPQPYEDVKKYNYQFHIYGDGALVLFEQEAETKSRELRIMEKKNGKWKIAVVEAIYNFSSDDDLAEGM